MWKCLTLLNSLILGGRLASNSLVALNTRGRGAGCCAAVLAALPVGVEAEGVFVVVISHEVYDALLVCIEMLVVGSFHVVET
jgi:hypothetical protein